MAIVEKHRRKTKVDARGFFFYHAKAFPKSNREETPP
jgi:hypothetical protein